MSKNTGINNQNLKSQNRGLILQLIATNNHLSRIELARISKLTKMSVTNIVSEFIEKDLVIETSKEVKTSVGRTPIILDISPKAPKIIGILINRDVCTAVLCDLKLDILSSQSETIDKCDYNHLLTIIYHLVDEMLKCGDKVIGIGVASIGPVNIDKGMILNPPNFYGITDVPIVALLKERYNLPVFLDNHYNAAALAEKLYGNGKVYSDFIFLGITNGIGSGIISEGQLYRNVNGLTSELGHTCIDYNGKECSCGNKGCLETYASSKVILTKYREITGESISFKELCQRKEEPVVCNLLLDMTEKLSIGLINGINLLNPEAIIMGHESVYLPEYYLMYLEEKINQYKLSKSYTHIDVQKAFFGYDSQLVGSACCFIDHIFHGEFLFE